MARTQTSPIEMVETPKEADRLNRELLEMLDEAGVPADSKANSELALKLANHISRRIFELFGIQKTIGVELEFVADSPKLAFFEVSGGCSTC